MLKKSIIFLIFFLLTAKNFAQNMQVGFNSLEAGKYLEASIFFKNVLKKHPNNKTAKICYGRAIGLQGQSKKALYLFKELLEKNPDDLETFSQIAVQRYMIDELREALERIKARRFGVCEKTRQLIDKPTLMLLPYVRTIEDAEILLGK